MIFPAKCPVCGEILAYGSEKRICEKCRASLPYVLPPRCQKCSKPIDSKESIYCFDCKNKTFLYDRGWALWLYKGDVVKPIYQFKYSYKKVYAKYFAKELFIHFNRVFINEQIDVIIPVPIHKSKYNQRGYNQAEEIAKELGVLCNIEVVNLLTRNKPTVAQKNLNNKERKKNLDNAFALEVNDFGFKNILIVDDIYTTGSTINACTKALKIYNTNAKVFFVCICIGCGF